MTPTELAVLEDMLRTHALPESVVRRMLFAALPRRATDESTACAICGVGLEVRPVLRTVHTGVTAGGSEGRIYTKRVHMKPRQFVVELRREGSFDLVDGAPILPEAREALTWRFCPSCVRLLLPDENEVGASVGRPPSETAPPSKSAPA